MGLRIILLPEARDLFRRGILRGMFSYFESDGIPKYVWSVDENDEVYEAKISPGTITYKGYRLEEEDPMRQSVLKEWKKRASEN